MSRFVPDLSMEAEFPSKREGGEGRAGEILHTAGLDSVRSAWLLVLPGELWGEKDNPKTLLERRWDSSRRKENFKVEAGC